MPAKTINILFFGDIVGKLGRKTVAAVLPEWKKKFKPDVVIANVENLTHGKGVTVKTLTEMKTLGIDIFTGGNHVWSKEDPAAAEIKDNFQLALPANVELTHPGQHSQKFNLGDKELVVLNLLSKEGINFEDTNSPFLTFDRLYAKWGKPKLLLVDLHSEMTSEKVASGWYLGDRASAVLGTHTHVTTADARVLPNGCAFISDVGMTGALDEVLGVQKQCVINRFLGNEPEPFVWTDEGPTQANAVLIKLNAETGRAIEIKQLHQEFKSI